MQYNLRAENLTLTEIDHRDLDKKLDRLQRHLTPPYTIDVTLQHDAHHLKGNVITCRINIEHRKKVFHVERVGDTIADTLDEVIHALKRELERDHDKRKDHT